ncbi:MAG: GNAT family N-acetyltransferase [Shewanella sp.]
MLPNDAIHIVPFEAKYARQVSELFHLAVQQIQHERYPKALLNAWSAAPRSDKHWQLRLGRTQAWILLVKEALGPQQCVGFINMATDFAHRGEIDSLYIHPDWQRQGLGKRAYRHLEDWAISQGYASLQVDASYLSRGLFMDMGFTQIQRSYQQKLGQILPSFYLRKMLPLNETLI